MLNKEGNSVRRPFSIREQLDCLNYLKPKGMHWFPSLYEQANEYEHMGRLMWIQQFKELKHGFFKKDIELDEELPNH
ncbi:MAG: hypothetical protein ABFC94_16380 [Syntrophomonas sp.]